MAAQSYDRLEGVIWYDGKLVPWNEANLHVLSHGLHYASCVFEGERAYGGRIFKMHRAFGAAEALGQCARLRDPLFGRRDRRRQETGAGEERQERGLCAPGGLARLGDDGRLGAGQHHSSGDRELGMAELFRSRAAAQGHQARSRRLPPARSEVRAGQSQGGRALHDLHHLQARGRAQRLCRRHDAGLGGARGRMHRRQHLLRQGRQDPHADRRLLPRRA